MDWGMKNRMARIIRPDTGRAVMLALDHGYFLGPTHRLEVPKETITPLLPYADTIMLTRGVLRSSVDPDSGANVVLRVSGGTSIAGPHLEDEGITVDFEEAIRLNVAGVGLSVFVGTEFERQTLLGLSELVNQGERYGIPVLGITAVGKELEKRDSRYLALCCRICAELGARIVKTYYCEDFEKVTGSCPVPDSDRGRSQARYRNGRFQHDSRGDIPGRRGGGHGKKHLAAREPRGYYKGNPRYRSREHDP